MQRKFFGTWGCGGQDLALMLPERKVPHWVAMVVAVVLASCPGQVLWWTRCTRLHRAAYSLCWGEPQGIISWEEADGLSQPGLPWSAW